MAKRVFHQVDVFPSVSLSYLGNALAVVIIDDVDGSIPTETLQKFACWTNLAETTYLFRPTDPQADYHVRIFTTTRELLFAGHPTLGTCSVCLQYNKPKNGNIVFQQCGVGLVKIKVSEENPRLVSFAAPKLIKEGPVDSLTTSKLASILSIDPSEILESQWVDNGPGWVAVLLEDAAKVKSIKAPTNTDGLSIGVIGFYQVDNKYKYEVRAFIQEGARAVEDPVCGSLNASIAQWLLKSGKVTAPYEAHQGTCVARDGTIYISSDSDHVWVGGMVDQNIVGSVFL